MTALALDFSIEGMEPPALSDAYRPPAPKDPWHERRSLAIGGSEVGALMVAYGLAPLGADLPRWLLEEYVVPYKALGVPKLLAQKAGLRARPKGGGQKVKDAGSELERELLAQYRATLAKHRLDPRSIRHADTLPKQFFPLVDRHCHALAVTPDAWARARDGELTMIELKTTYHPLKVVRPPWHYVCQLQAEIAACSARYGLLVIGEGWIQPEASAGGASRSRGPIRAFAFERDEQLIHLVRTVAAEAWSVVERLRDVALEFDEIGKAQTKKAREGRKACAAKCAEIWRESRERMQAFADPTREALEDALGAVEGLDELADFAA